MLPPQSSRRFVSWVGESAWGFWKCYKTVWMMEELSDRMVRELLWRYIFGLKGERWRGYSLPRMIRRPRQNHLLCHLQLFGSQHIHDFSP